MSNLNRDNRHKGSIGRAGRLLERMMGEVMFGRWPLQAVVAELRAEWTEPTLTNWSSGLARSPNGHPLGVLAPAGEPLATADNAVAVGSELNGFVRLSVRLAKGNRDARTPTEIALYADADGERGVEVLDALSSLATGTWSDIPRTSPGTEQYPRMGIGPIWANPDGIVDWTRLIRLPFAERFLRVTLPARGGGHGSNLACVGRTSSRLLSCAHSARAPLCQPLSPR
jgi:hypothetical protein